MILYTQAPPSELTMEHTQYLHDEPVLYLDFFTERNVWKVQVPDDDEYIEAQSGEWLEEWYNVYTQQDIEEYEELGRVVWYD